MVAGRNKDCIRLTPLGSVGNTSSGFGRRESEEAGHKYLQRIPASLVPRWEVDLFQIGRSWQDRGLSLPVVWRGCNQIIQRSRWPESTGVLGWEDSLFCKPQKEFRYEKRGSAATTRHGFGGGGIATPQIFRALATFSRWCLFGSWRCTQICPLF